MPTVISCPAAPPHTPIGLLACWRARSQLLAPTAALRLMLSRRVSSHQLLPLRPRLRLPTLMLGGRAYLLHLVGPRKALACTISLARAPHWSLCRHQPRLHLCRLASSDRLLSRRPPCHRRRRSCPPRRVRRATCLQRTARLASPQLLPPLSACHTMGCLSTSHPSTPVRYRLGFRPGSMALSYNHTLVLYATQPARPIVALYRHSHFGR